MRIKKIIFFSIVILCSCKSSIEHRPFTVQEVLNGNTIRLVNGLKVQLIGITNSNSSSNYLSKIILNKKIKIIFDSRTRKTVTSKDELVYGYLIDENKHCINSEILKKGLANLDTFALNDSLDIYKYYSANASPYYSSESTTNSRTNISPSVKKDIQTIVKQSEPSIFVVISFDRNDNPIGQGTGFFIKENNIGVSNFHVFEDGFKWIIKTNRDEFYNVSSIVKKNSEFDYVIFKVQSEHSFTPLKISLDTPDKGEDIIVIGNPQGLENTVTRGVISAFRTNTSRNDLIQIDAAISPGSSGSPVINLYGEVIGIATMKIRDCENCNFAFSITVLDL